MFYKNLAENVFDVKVYTNKWGESIKEAVL
jgi:hypothetical protein